jgi:uncharacterized membrane protein
MDARAKLLGHPVHQMLVVFPLGLLATAVIFDLVYFGTENPVHAHVAFWMVVAGVAGGLVAAPFGLIDWLSIPPGTRAKRIGAMHGGGNLIVTLLFLSSALLRYDRVIVPPDIAYACSFAGALLALVTAWLGGELVDRLGIGVHSNANVDAPSSLRRARVP